MEDETSLVFINKADKMLEKASTIQEIKEFKNIALTAADWAKRKGLGKKVVKKAQNYALDAEIKLGDKLRETERAKGKRTDLVTLGNQVDDNKFTLAELGITKRESSEAQLLSDLSQKDQEKIIAIKDGKKSKKTTVNEKRREDKRKELKAKSLIPGDKKYRIIYADPPWKYDRYLPHQYGDPEKHYPPMSIDEICAMPVIEMIEENSVLFLWVTSPKIEESFKIIKAWGFKYKTSFIWDKVKHNFGHYNSIRHEFLLIGGKGSSTPDCKKLFNSVVSIERSKIHSQKPEYFRDLIDILYTWGNRIELFFRGNKIKKGWDVWGNEN